MSDCDALWVEQCLDGDREVFARLVERHRQSVFNRRRYTKLERKKQYLEREFVMPVLEYAEAKKQGLEKDPYVMRTLKNLMVFKLMRKLRGEFKTAEPTEAELKAFFEKHQDDYNQPELIRVSHILLKDKATADKVAAEAKGKSRVEFRRGSRSQSTTDSSGSFSASSTQSDCVATITD